MEQIVIRTSKPPYGIAFVAKRNGIHLQLQTITGSEMYAQLPRAVAEHLRAELDAALAESSEAVA